MSRYLLTLALASAVTAVSAANPVVEVKTSMGKFKVELYEKEAPETVKNFLRYVDDKFYDGTIFHRVMSDFMIQGGGFEPGLKQKRTRGNIKNEAHNGKSNARGTIAMARLPAPHTASAQFFINVVDNKGLDHKNKSDEGYGYCVFGKVTEGMDVVDKIKAVETGTAAGHRNVPVKDVVIESIRRVDKK